MQTAKVGESLDQNTLMVVAFVCQVKVFVCYDMVVSQSKHARDTGYYSHKICLSFHCSYNRKQLIKSISSNAVCVSNDRNADMFPFPAKLMSCFSYHIT
jgi:hypothetical protein